MPLYTCRLVHQQYPYSERLLSEVPLYMYSGTPLIQTLLGQKKRVLIWEGSLFQGLKSITTWEGRKCPVQRGVLISGVSYRGVPLHVVACNTKESLSSGVPEDNSPGVGLQWWDGSSQHFRESELFLEIIHVYDKQTSSIQSNTTQFNDT